MTDLSIALAQINPIVGDLAGNTEKILTVWKQAEGDIILFPEMIVCGYPPEDLVLKPFFLARVRETVEALIGESKHVESAAVIGCPWEIEGQVYNVVHLIQSGEIIATQAKVHLPNYGVFDEARIFKAGALPDVITFKNTKIGILVCEDMWFDDVAAHLKAQGAKILLVPNASPFEISKGTARFELAKQRVKDTGIPLVYVNQIGGQDELVFDGGSFVMDAEGAVVCRLKAFEEDIYHYCHPERSEAKSKDLKNSKDLSTTVLRASAQDDNCELIYKALCLGLKDYVGKNGFKGVLIGLSGGIDSAISAAIACDALGAENVHCVMMPSQFTSQDSLDDAKALADNLGCTYEVISIETVMRAFEDILNSPPQSPPPAGGKSATHSGGERLSGVAHENMQSRSRGLILMALSNSTGKMVLSTGNKSEVAVGYATLYGDMCGGYNVLKDLYKTQVYAVSNWVNRDNEIIPTRIITKAPTAELRDNQTDQDSLPEYEVLDDILECLIEHDMGIEDIIAHGHKKDEVMRVWRLLDIAEYKRHQAPPGVKITSRSFGRDRRYPITNKFRN